MFSSHIKGTKFFLFAVVRYITLNWKTIIKVNEFGNVKKKRIIKRHNFYHFKHHFKESIKR